MTGPASVERNGTQIVVETPSYDPPPCDMPIDPPEPYETSADLGVLAPGSYTLTWTQPEFWESTIEFDVAATGVATVPATGLLAGLALAFSLLLMASRAFRRGG